MVEVDHANDALGHSMLTAEEKRQLVAKHLDTIIAGLAESDHIMRCGGLDYIDGKPFYHVGGGLVPPEIFSQGSNAVKAFLKAKEESRET